MPESRPPTAMRLGSMQRMAQVDRSGFSRRKGRRLSLRFSKTVRRQFSQ